MFLNKLAPSSGVTLKRYIVFIAKKHGTNTKLSLTKIMFLLENRETELKCILCSVYQGLHIFVMANYTSAQCDNSFQFMFPHDWFPLSHYIGFDVHLKMFNAFSIVVKQMGFHSNDSIFFCLSVCSMTFMSFAVKLEMYLSAPFYPITKLNYY